MKPSEPEQLARVLAGGGIAVLATDTLPGLHCRADHAASVARLRALKGRARDKPLLLLCASPAQALAMTRADERQTAYAQRCWPGPFTLILPAGPLAPNAAIAGGGAGAAGGATVALRVPAVTPLRHLIEEAGGPLVSTSANLAGEPASIDLAEAVRRFGAGIDAVSPDWPPDGGGDAAGAGRPGASALIDLLVWPPRLLRDGPLPPPPWP